MPILREDLEDVTVKVNRVHRVAGPEQAQADEIALLDPNRLGVRKRLSIDREEVVHIAGLTAFAWPIRPLADPGREHEKVVLRDLLLDRAWIPRLDHKRAPHAAHRDMLMHVDVDNGTTWFRPDRP
jgi:hypothetical protein